MTTENTADRDIVDLDARVSRAVVMDQIVAMLGRSPSWPR